MRHLTRPAAGTPSAPGSSATAAAILAALRDPEHGRAIGEAIMDLIFDDIIEAIDIRTAKGHSEHDSRATQATRHEDADEDAELQGIGDANEEWSPDAAGDDAGPEVA